MDCLHLLTIVGNRLVNQNLNIKIEIVKEGKANPLIEARDRAMKSRI